MVKLPFPCFGFLQLHCVRTVRRRMFSCFLQYRGLLENISHCHNVQVELILHIFAARYDLHSLSCFYASSSTSRTFMDRTQYANCRSSMSEDILEDEASEFLEKAESRKWWLSANAKASQIIVGLIFILTIVNTLSLYIWLRPTTKAAPESEPTVLDYFRKSFNVPSRAV